MQATVLGAAESEIIALIVAAAVLGAAGLFHRYIKKNVVVPLRAVPKLVIDIATAVDVAADNGRRLGNLETDVKAVKAEVFTNHGSSLRDSVNRNEVLTRAVAKASGIDADKLVPHQSPVDKGPGG